MSRLAEVTLDTKLEEVALIRSRGDLFDFEFVPIEQLVRLGPGGTFGGFEKIVEISFGHVFKIVSYAFLYQNVFVAAIRQPYEALRESEGRFRTLTDLSVDGYWKIRSIELLGERRLR